MIFEQNNKTENIGEKVGFVFAYFLFTIVLFFIFALFNTITSWWAYFDVMFMVVLIILIGMGIKRKLE